ncbi:MAG TPA: glycerol-3-phosphate 1-O-acyltransferase PlsY [Candidatus Cryosericum sp.]|nr:glycerol-3-phosphate 1-O-acyltransferase PlsY [Candidatus Cryosericum sp.]
MSAPLALACALGFLLGAIPFSWILARLLGGLDIRSVGSGNVGATNVARSLGFWVGGAALLLDASKGAAAAWLGQALDPAGPSGGGGLLAGGLAVLGHNFTPFLGFRGGKGVATGAGVFAVLAPKAVLASVAVFAIALGWSRTVSLGSILAAAALPVAAWLTGAGGNVVALALLVAILVIARHAANLRRLARGEEPRIGRASKVDA